MPNTRPHLKIKIEFFANVLEKKLDGSRPNPVAKLK